VRRLCSRRRGVSARRERSPSTIRIRGMSNAAASSEPQKLIFEQAFEGLFLLGLKEHLSPELKEKLRGRGLDLDRPLLPAYPYPVWHGALDEAVAHLWPDLPHEEGYRRIGRRVVEGYRS